MNWFKSSLFAATVAASAMSLAQGVVPGEILVKAAPNGEVGLNSAIASAGARILETSPQIGWSRVKLRQGMTVSQGIAYFRRLRFVSGVSANPIPVLLDTPNDPMLGQQWHIPRVDLPEAWDIEIGDEDVKIAILDTGVDLTHPDLIANLLPGTDPGDGDNDPTDTDGHGTHVAGIAAAVTNNGVGVAGAGRDCSILPVKVFGSRGGIAVAEGIVWAADNDANVISMSLKIGDFQALRDAIAYAKARNVFIVAAAGNDNSTAVNYPAGYPDVMAVASSDPDDSRSGFSTYGSWVDVAAPGNNIHSTYPGGYGQASGTSMACPLVAGIAGLIWTKGGPGYTYDRVWDAITNSCEPVPGDYVIHGRVNAYEALRETTIIITLPMPALTATPFAGANAQGNVASLLADDNDYMTLEAETIARFGKAAGIEVSFDVPELPSGEYIGFQMNVRSRSTRNTTGMLWLRNVSTGQWDFIKAFPVKSGEQTHTITINHFASRYMEADGTVMARLRGHIPHRNAAAAAQFIYSWDMVELAGQYEEPIP